MKAKQIITTLIIALFVLPLLFAATEEERKAEIKRLKREKLIAINAGDEERATMIHNMIKDLKDGKDVGALAPKTEEVPTGPSEEALSALKKPEIKKIQRVLDKKGGEDLKAKLNKSQLDEYTARGLLLDGKKLLVRGEYNQAKAILTDAYNIKSKDEDIIYYYKLAHFPKISIVSSKGVYSLLKDKEVTFNINNVADKNGHEVWAKKWKVDIIRERGEKHMKSFNGEGNTPPSFVWDGKDDSGKIAKDGVYIVKSHVEADYFCKMTPADYKFEIQAKPPAVQIKVAQEMFIPGDEEVEISIIFEDAAEIKEWDLTIINQVGTLIKRFSGTKIKDKIVWDGVGDNGSLVNQGETLTFKMKGKDQVGAKWESNDEKILADIKITFGKIVLNNIEFETGKAKLKPESLPILDLVVNLLEQRIWFDVVVEGHTDHVGKEAYNKGLSERRAKSVMDYIVQKGIPSTRLKSQGMGEGTPLTVNADNAKANPFLKEGDVLKESFIKGLTEEQQEIAKQMNRRVEFSLKENTEKKEAYIKKQREDAIKRAMEGGEGEEETPE